MTHLSDVLVRWQLISPHLNRRHQMLWAAAEAQAIGNGGCMALVRITGISWSPISKRMRTLRSTNKALPGSLAHLRTPWRAGRKFCEVNDPSIVPALELMLADEIAGD